VNPRHPVYIVSKGRAESGLTAHFLDKIEVPYHLVVEAQEVEAYADHFPAERLLVLDPAFQEAYDTCDDLGASKSRGPGAARNFAWEHSLQAGHAWHWVMDDNIRFFGRLHRNQRIVVGDGTIFHAMETFAMRFRNVGMVGPAYESFTPSRAKAPAFLIGSRIYSCNLIRNSLPWRWRGRYNEDTDLSLRLLKHGWATVQFNAFIQKKVATQIMDGGCNDDFYKLEGTLPKSQMLVRLHPDVTKLVWRFGRWHHHVDYSQWRGMGLVKDESFTEETDYRLVLIGGEL
jgi:hypothetical protein